MTDAFRNCSSPGNALVEMVLFLPLALFLATVVIDAGFALGEKALLASALRAGLAVLSTEEEKANTCLMADNSPCENRKKIASNIANEIWEQLSFLPKAPLSVSPTAKVRVSVLNLAVDQRSGTLSSLPRIESTFTVTLPGNGPDAPDFCGDGQVPSADDYLKRILTSPPGISSPYAIAAPSADGQRNYLSTATVVYAELTAVNSGLYSKLLSRLFGLCYITHEQELVPLRIFF